MLCVEKNILGVFQRPLRGRSLALSFDLQTGFVPSSQGREPDQKLVAEQSNDDRRKKEAWVLLREYRCGVQVDCRNIISDHARDVSSAKTFSCGACCRHSLFAGDDGQNHLFAKAARGPLLYA